jgi:hypothetical protein
VNEDRHLDVSVGEIYPQEEHHTSLNGFVVRVVLLSNQLVYIKGQHIAHLHIHHVDDR